MSLEIISLELSRDQFRRISSLVYDMCGLNLRDGKEALVKARLAKRLRVLGLKSFDAYMDYVESDRSGAEVVTMIDALTTNKTGFFREMQHFEYFRKTVLPSLLQEGRAIKIWSAGCSSGEEPFSIAILLNEDMPGTDRLKTRILATDISSRVICKCHEAVYDGEALQGVPEDLIEKYFTMMGRSFKVSDKVRSMVRFARLNLMEPWPMKGPFDTIFCRNVMIYFDKETQQELVRRFHELLEPGGYLFVGCSESLTALSSDLRCVRPAIYVKTAD